MPSDSRGIRPHTPPPRSVLLGTALALLCAALTQSVVGCAPQPHTSQPTLTTSTGQDRFPVIVRTPVGKPSIKSGAFDEKGNPITIACATCHTTRPADPVAKLGVPTTAFHQGLKGHHGNLSCVSCHNPADGYDSLRLADGRRLDFPEVMTLCAQCHGPQFRDYQHGAHGGMTGHWDLTKGGRVRNNCVDCHDPHAPKYPTLMPARGPNDRFQTGGGHE